MALSASVETNPTASKIETRINRTHCHTVTPPASQALLSLRSTEDVVVKSLRATGKAARLKGFEDIKAVILEVEHFSVDNDLMTPSFKLRRVPLLKRYQVGRVECGCVWVPGYVLGLCSRGSRGSRGALWLGCGWLMSHTCDPTLSTHGGGMGKST